MKLEIREMRPEDMDGKAFVHYTSWQETYTGLMETRFLSGQTQEKCRAIAQRWPQNTLVAELDGVIVGYGCFIRHEDGTGEVSALYLLKEHQGKGIGRKLMDALMEQLTGCVLVILWVLEGNDQAIGFYAHYGFRFDGGEKTAPFGTELQMRYL